MAKSGGGAGRGTYITGHPGDPGEPKIAPGIPPVAKAAKDFRNNPTYQNKVRSTKRTAKEARS